jgi:hypothetical protein
MGCLNINLHCFTYGGRDEWFCHNLNLGLTIKVRAYEGAGQVWSLGVTFHAPESAREWKNEPSNSQVMSSHFGSWSPNGLPNP